MDVMSTSPARSKQGEINNLRVELIQLQDDIPQELVSRPVLRVEIHRGPTKSSNKSVDLRQK